MLIQIKHHWNGTSLHTIEADSLKVAIERLVAAGADLRGADLRGAYLRGANLTDAYLTGAYLRGANLTDAYLRGAYLRGANLTDANLTDADLTDANLRGADLRGAYLRGANLTDANLTGADLTDANLRGAYLTDAYLTDAYLTGANLMGADLTGANLTGAESLAQAGVPVVKNLHTEMLAAINAGKDAGGGLEMSTWHTCETTHCRAGWAITLAGAAGRALEFAMGPATAGALITMASCPYLEKVPDFYCGNEAALKDIEACAAKEAAAA